MTKLDTYPQTINSPLVTRLKAQMVRKGLNPKTLAERANVGRSFVYDILSGRSCNPTSGKIAAIADELGVSMQYLLSGTHPDSSPFQQNWADIVEISTIAIESTLNGNILVSKDKNTTNLYYNLKWIKDNFHVEPTSIRSFSISCDSMYPTLKINDNVLIDISKNSINPPGLYLLFDGVALKPRRLEMANPARIIVRADNDKYSGYETNPNDIHIVGKIIWLGRSL